MDLPRCEITLPRRKIDSATAGMNALVQNDSSVNGLGWILDSQKMKISLRWNPYLSSLPVFLTGMISYRDDSS